MTLMIWAETSAIFVAFHIAIDNLSLVQIRLWHWFALGSSLLYELSLVPLFFLYLRGQ